MSDRAWIRGLLEKHEGALVRYALRFTRDLEQARDVVQDTFCKLCLQPRDKVAGKEVEWLFAVTRNRALDVLKKEGRMQELNEAELGSRASAEPAPAAVAETKDDANKVSRLVAALPPNQREVVRLKFQNGLSYKEISRVTELSVSNVGYLLHVALKSLRSQLSEPGLPAQA